MDFLVKGFAMFFSSSLKCGEVHQVQHQAEYHDCGYTIFKARCFCSTWSDRYCYVGERSAIYVARIFNNGRIMRIDGDEIFSRYTGLFKDS